MISSVSLCNSILSSFDQEHRLQSACSGPTPFILNVQLNPSFVILGSILFFGMISLFFLRKITGKNLVHLFEISKWKRLISLLGADTVKDERPLRVEFGGRLLIIRILWQKMLGLWLNFDQPICLRMTCSVPSTWFGGPRLLQKLALHSTADRMQHFLCT